MLPAARGGFQGWCHGRPRRLGIRAAGRCRAAFSGEKVACAGVIDDGSVVGFARWGIAENASLVMHSASDAPVLLNFLPAVHIVAVHASSIVAHLEDYAAAARRAGDPAPRELHIIVVDDVAEPNA